MQQQTKPLFDSIPPPMVVADRLGDAMREVSFLKKLLKTSKAAELEKRNLAAEATRRREEVAHAAA